MKEKKLEKAEMKESLLSGEALALNDAELEGAAGGMNEMVKVERLDVEGMSRAANDFLLSSGRVPIENSQPVPMVPVEDEKRIQEILESPEFKELQREAESMRYRCHIDSSIFG